jgi:hypothetical protein
VYIFLFYESNKYFMGTLFSLKMRYLNKQGQQASLKISKGALNITYIVRVSHCSSHHIWTDDTRNASVFIILWHITGRREGALDQAKTFYELFNLTPKEVIG